MIKGFKISFINSQMLNAYVDKIKKIPWFLGKNAFLFILIFILMSIAFGGFLFYQYIFLVSNKEPNIVNISTEFKKDIYQSVLNELQTRENTFKNLPQENYPDQFR